MKLPFFVQKSRNEIHCDLLFINLLKSDFSVSVQSDGRRENIENLGDNTGDGKCEDIVYYPERRLNCENHDSNRFTATRPDGPSIGSIRTKDKKRQPHVFLEIDYTEHNGKHRNYFKKNKRPRFVSVFLIIEHNRASCADKVHKRTGN